MKRLLVISAAALLLSAGMAAAAAKKQKAPPKPRSEASLECSKQANEKGLKGKPRKAFRTKCIRSYKKAA